MPKKVKQIDNTHEAKFLNLFNKLFPNLVLGCEHKFHPDRRWRFDFVLVDHKIAFEIEGGIWVGGRHIHPLGFIKDCEKYNEATKLGWKVYRLTPEFIKEEYIKSLL